MAFGRWILVVTSLSGNLFLLNKDKEVKKRFLSIVSPVAMFSISCLIEEQLSEQLMQGQSSQLELC